MNTRGLPLIMFGYTLLVISVSTAGAAAYSIDPSTLRADAITNLWILQAVTGVIGLFATAIGQDQRDNGNPKT